MTVTAQTSSNSSTGNGVTTVFPYTFKIIDDGDIEVRVDGVLQTLSTHYTVSGVGDNAGGNVTMLTAPANGAIVARRRNMALVRATDYQYQGNLPAAVLNPDQDAPVLMVQQMQEQISRSARGPAGETWTELPAAADRLDLFPVFDATTGALELSTVTQTQVANAVAAAYAAGSTADAVTFLPAGTGANTRTVQAKLRESVSVTDFGAVGDGSDETTEIQNAFNAAAAGVVPVLFEAGKTYGYTTLTVPAGVGLLARGVTFLRLAASTTHGFTLGGDNVIDQLVISTPGGTGGDKAVAIRGSNVNIGFLNITAAAQGNSSSTNWAVEVESSPSGTNISRVHIEDLFCSNFSTAYIAKRTSLCSVNNAIVEYYRTAFYLRDNARSTYRNVTCRLTGAASNGVPGENGLLLESSVGSGSTTDLLFENWYVANAGEHGYRLGGQLAIKDVWFKNCVAEKSGSAILLGNTSSGEWHGGCGFKVLGGNSTITEFHENIHFDNCGVIDCSIQYGSYPAGHGVNNFTPWLIVMAKNVHMSGCWTKAVSQAYCARNGILFTAVDGLHLDANSFRDINLVAIKPYRETPIPGFPGSDLAIKNVVINGGFYEVTTATAGNGIPIYMEEATTVANENWIVNGAVLKGGASALRIETAGGGGSYANLQFNFNYIGTNVTDATYGTTAIAGGGAAGAVVNVVAPWRPLAGSPTVGNGSTWTSPNDGEVRTRTDGVWRRGMKTYTAVIADDAVATIVPPAADTGFIAVTGSGTATHLFGWYRATSSPQSSKYAGAATADMVNTTLTGTTGVDGNVTVGIQDNLIYIENRNGSQNTFQIDFV